VDLNTQMMKELNFKIQKSSYGDVAQINILQVAGSSPGRRRSSPKKSRKDYASPGRNRPLSFVQTPNREDMNSPYQNNNLINLNKLPSERDGSRTRLDNVSRASKDIFDKHESIDGHLTDMEDLDNG